MTPLSRTATASLIGYEVDVQPPLAICMAFKFPEKKLNQTWEEAIKTSHDWFILSRQERSKLLKEAQKRDRISEFNRLALVSESIPVASVEETPFEIPQGMTPEDATVLKIQRDAERWPTSVSSSPPLVSPASPITADPPASFTPAPAVRFTGPRGGKFRINASGRKIYDVT